MPEGHADNVSCNTTLNPKELVNFVLPLPLGNPIYDMLILPPLSLYIHVPWCVKKCPYCDFNSHKADGVLPENEYVQALLNDFQQELKNVQGRSIHSIFIGGGTPSLLSAEAYQGLFTGLKNRVSFSDDIEITMEANPGTYEHDRFQAYFEIGINRLSLGVQSFQDEKLKALGRIHSAIEAKQAIAQLADSGFENVNIDLMHGLPNQSQEDALHDLQQAVALQPAHISWYQLTIEPNTVFYSKTPKLPEDDTLWAIQEAGQQYLADNGFAQYEISAYSRPERRSKHNMNYWQFGDYIGIGAGAHGKLTNLQAGSVTRNWKTRMPKDYLSVDKVFEAGCRTIKREDMPIEFMMNALRLNGGVPKDLFSQRTGLPAAVLNEAIALAQKKGLLEEKQHLQPTTQGRLFLNDLLALFT